MIDKIRDVFGFTDKDIKIGLRQNLLLSMEIEFSSRCNLSCVYCYAGSDLFRKDELDLDEMLDVISQGKALGARKIIYVGAGEPLLDPKLRRIIEYVHKLDMEHILFTNATLIDFELAHFFHAHKLTVVVKYTSRNAEVHDMLSGTPGAYRSMKRGLDFLFEAGYPDKDHVLGIEAVLCKQNIDEIPSIWKWARDKNILPYVEYLTRAGLAKDREDLFLTGKEAGKVFEELSKIDAKKYGFFWKPHPPIAGFPCKRHLYSCTINSQGFVLPCVGIDIRMGNIREEKLANILRNNKVRNKLITIRKTIKGACKTCSLKSDCYGCRGTAYNLTGDYLASDPTCWKVAE